MNKSDFSQCPECFEDGTPIADSYEHCDNCAYLNKVAELDIPECSDDGRAQEWLPI